MAEETFNPDSMPKTDRYQIPYPGPDNLVRYAADQFGAMANAIDTQLGNVDDRATDKAHATIVRNTLAELQASSPVQGQLGYVTADPTADNIGLWLWNGASWSKVSGATPMTVVKPTLAELQTVTDLSEGVFGLVSDDPVASNNGVYVFNNSAWAPITGTSGGTLAASTLTQLQSTTAPTGTLAYVSADPTPDNNLVYVRTAAAAWTPVGGPQTQIITDGFTAKINQKTPKLTDIWGTINGKIATIHALAYIDSSSVMTLETSGAIFNIGIPESMRPTQQRNFVARTSFYGTLISGYSLQTEKYSPIYTCFDLPAKLSTDGSINFGTFDYLEDKTQMNWSDSSIYSIQVSIDASWLIG